MRKHREFIFIAFLTILLFPAIAVASYSVTQYPYLPPLEKMHENGEYSIYVEDQGNWTEAGNLTFDEFFRDRAIDLSNYISGDGRIRIRIVQKNGGAAHIDSIFLGGKPPVEVRDVENGIKKLSQKDFDIIDAYGKSLDMEFLVNGGNRILKLTARIEGTSISKIPFLFPLKNLFKTIDRTSQFYTYKLNSHRGTIKIDGVLDETANLNTFFSEYYPSGSGHPSGFTYGWVWNDDENLYVAIDFTPDNTMDGDKDYAKIYVNTEDGLKEFKVSVPDTTWGRPAFAYTNKVGYQHKVYEFKVPFKEILKGSIKSEGELQLAFSAYGTATASRPVIYCGGVVPGQEPTIDGVWTSGEWGNPAQLMINPGTDPNQPSNELLTYFYCKNDSTDLYVLVDAVGDVSDDSDCDECAFDFHNGVVSVPAEIYITGTGSGTTLPAGAAAAVGYSTTINNFTNNHRIYEFKIPLISINALPGQMIDFASPASLQDKYCGHVASMPYDGSTGKDNIWPRGLVFSDINTWGFLQLDDGDGVPAQVEDVCTPGGDGNEDSIPDSLQSTVASLYSATGRGCITLITDEPSRTDEVILNTKGTLNGGLCFLQKVQALTEQQAAPSQEDPLAHYPFGLVAFEIPCENATVRIIYHGTDSLEGFTYRKFGPTPDDWFTAIWYDFSASATIDGNEVTLTLCDGCLGDDTDFGDGIVDQGGPGGPGEIPTMTEWGMIIFVVLAGFGAVYYLRRQKRAER